MEIADTSDSTEDDHARRDNRRLIANLVAGSLEGSQRTVIALRLAGMTLERIGNRLGVSKERIRQIEAIAMTKLRRAAARAGWTEEMFGLGE